MVTSERIEKNEKTYVYDISLDGTVINALGMNVLSNTDGFDFQMPKTFRYTDEHPYISNGSGRNSIKGQAYTCVDADIAEFEDTFLHSPFNGGVKKFGLGLDEYCDACCQLSRKNYFCLMDDGKIKMVGNTIKSKKMPLYIERFLNENIPILLDGRGKDFLENYYDYVEKIYNMRIPLKEIASVGKIKISLEEYKESCKKVTAAGTKKARQAWYELAIKDNLNVHMGDSIYYINTGTRKGDADVERITKYFLISPDGKKIEYAVNKDWSPVLNIRNKTISLDKYIKDEYERAKKAWKNGIDDFMSKYPFVMSYGKHVYSSLQEEDILSFNCVRLNNEVVEDEDDHFCDDTFEYNAEKYLDMFNKRIKPILVCFDKSVRSIINEKGEEESRILINNPKDRKTFTIEEGRLVGGQPFHITDQDTYEQLLTIEDKEIEFWMRVNKKPPFVDECGIDWESVKEDYKKRAEKINGGYFE